MISVIVLTAGKRKRLSCTLASLVNQTYKNFEVIVGLDGDPSKIKDIIKKYRRNFPLRLISIHHTGEFRMAWTFNKASRAARGKYCLYLGEDTLLPSEGIKKMYQEVSKPKVKNQFFVVADPRMEINLKDLTINKVLNNFGSIAKKAKIVPGYCQNELDSGGIIFKKHIEAIGGECELIPGVSMIAELKIRLRLELGVRPKLISLPIYHIHHNFRAYKKKHACRYFLTDLALKKIPRWFIKKYFRKYPDLVNKIVSSREAIIKEKVVEIEREYKKIKT